MSGGKPISRRAALARLGLGAAGVYMAPALAGLSQARASTASGASAASAASAASPASPASDPSPASAPSTASSVSPPSGPSGPGACRSSSLSGDAQISRRDYQRAQRAIARGDARPLREVLKTLRAEHPGKVLEVGFSDKGGQAMFQVLIVDPSGAVISVSVDAGSGLVTNMWKC